MTEPLMTAFDRLADRINAIREGRPALFFINPGNWGDSLIREGAEQFLRHYDIPHHVVMAKDIQKNRTTVAAETAKAGYDDPVMIYNGCGAFSPHYETAPRVAALAQQFTTAIVLPSTFAIDIADYDFPAHTHFFVRDQFESQKRMPDAMFCHDMAFFLKLSGAEPTKDAGWLLRNDRETPEGGKPPWGNVDISQKGRAHTPIEDFVSAIAKYRVVHSNRLHVGICSALLGRETHIYSNDYFKVRAIFDSSVRPYFDNAQYHEGLPDYPKRRFFGLFG